MAKGQKSLESALEEAVSRALRDNLAPLQRTAEELQAAYADLVAACASSRPTNALPAMLRAQTAASALAAGLSVLSNFVTVALNQRDAQAAEAGEKSAGPRTAAMEIEEPSAEAGGRSATEAEPEWAEDEAAASAASLATEPAAEPFFDEPQAAKAPAFEVANLPSDLQDLHRRANRVAKVTMQDIKLLKPKEVRLGREHHDICRRLRSDLDKARKEYDRRFHAILDHPVDYFHRWMVEILAEGDAAALGEYPYPSPVLRH